MSGKFVPICGPVSANSIYCDGDLVSRDSGVTLPEIVAMTYEIQAMGAMTVPDWSRIEHMETAINRSGIDRNLSKMTKPGKHELEIRGVYPVKDASGKTTTVGFKAFITGESNKIPGIGVNIGELSESELTYSTSRFQLIVDGYEMWCIDRLAGICRIAGVEYSNINSYL